MEKQKERLVELIRKADKKGLIFYRDNAAELSFANLILADGWMRPPCKVGQTVYKVVADKRVKKPYECKVVGVWYAEDEFANNVHLARYVNGMFDCSFSVQFKEFGKTVFLTKEEAEQALRKDEGK